MPVDTCEIDEQLRSVLFSEDDFCPSEPKSLEETGLGASFVEGLICKFLANSGTASGRSVAETICLPFSVLADSFNSLRTRQIISPVGAAPFNDHYYALTEHGQSRAASYLRACAYIGPAPVPLSNYINSVHAQAITWSTPKYEQLIEAFRGISIEPTLLAKLGPAVNSGAGMFLYGAPGNGKSTIAKRITSCFGHKIWIPHAIIEGGQLIKFFDAAFHRVVDEDSNDKLLTKEKDARWLQIWRPTVVVGGELLNRWIVPLECRHDFLTLANGKRIQVPFEQLIIFSTNLEPEDLVDEAFLRRIPYKIEVGDPSVEEFHYLFRLYCESMNCEYRKDVVNYLVDTHYRPKNRAMRRCHPRDLLSQIRSLTRYQDVPFELRPEYFDQVVECYFAMVLKERNRRDD